MKPSVVEILILLAALLFFDAAHAQGNMPEHFLFKNNVIHGGSLRFTDLRVRVSFLEGGKFNHAIPLREEGKTANNSPQNAKPREKKAKLTPEERRALRQQVRDVEQELHSPKK